MPFAATWMQLEIIMQSKSERERQIPYDVTYIWNLKHGTDESIYKTEIDSQTQRTDLWLPRGRTGGRGIDWEFGVGRCKLLYIGWINNKVLLQSTRNYIKYPVINHMGRNIKECVCVYIYIYVYIYVYIYIYIYITESLCCTAEINIVNQLYFS